MLTATASETRIRRTAWPRCWLLAVGLALAAAACGGRDAPAGPDPDLAALVVQLRTEGDGAPVAGAVVTLLTEDRRTGIATHTGAAGDATFRRIPPGAYLVEAAPLGGRAVAASQANPVAIALARGRTDTLTFRIAR